MARILGIQYQLAPPLVDAFLEALIETIHKGERVELRGFGSFTMYTKKARGGARNPRTGEACFIPERPGVKFKPAKALLGGKE
jgi:integration host factor subunit beta